MGERGRSLDSGHNRKSDSDKSSNSYYSDDDSSRASDHSPTISTQSVNTGEKSNKAQNLKSLPHYQGTKQIASKYAPSKRGIRWGFRSQSLNRESPAKDISLVTKRVLSARLLKINELRNELTELHVKLDELQKENRVLKRLQYRHEKALHKFEDTENEISQLLARHNDEMRILRERLRKSQEREQITERKLRASEEELYKAKSNLQKLRRLAEDRHLPERDELAKKLALAENRLDDTEKRIKDLEKNLDLSNSSFQRQLHSEKKKLCEAQEENKVLQEEVQRLSQKLKEKERELDAKNIYANRKLKPSPKKDVDIAPRKKAADKNTKREVQITKGVQTTGYISPVEFPLPPDFISDETPEEKEDDAHLRMEQAVKDWKEQAEHFKEEQSREREERLKSDQELQALEERAKKLRDEWEKEESERKKKENTLLLGKEEKVKMETEVYSLENGMQNNGRIEEERRKEILLTKMYEIDRETQINTKVASQEHTLEMVTIPYSLEKNKRPFQCSETTEKLFNGFLEYDQHSSMVTKGEIQKWQNTEATCSSNDLTFGSYVPSFGKVSGRPSWLNQKSDFLDEPTKEDVGLNTKREKKSSLMEQLFGSNANTITAPKKNDLGPFGQDSGTNDGFQDKGSTVKVKEDSDLFFSEGKNFNPKRHRLQHTANRPAVKALDFLEDEIEEVLLQ
ncbi:lebercilin [Rhineura floridana]|uniref:lebercilin n=1 Tax=Rhineura floridana TaxID=261503 RepID=UPI002AC8794A|nr:lebercilin [Rhineura floridana]XP_061479175.1 lebercilin [Rhineura floridana]XP_061479176.1 lebercilin [Rhineura floridana]